VTGVMTAGGKVDQPIARHGTQRQKMAVVAGGKQAISHYRVINRFRAHTHVKVKLETGRTHQIRVHLQSIGFPIVGDDKYGDFALNKALSRSGAKPGLKRMFLHAHRLTLTHPATGAPMTVSAPLPAECVEFLQQLRQGRPARDAD